jgi:hypothetical protein
MSLACLNEIPTLVFSVAFISKPLPHTISEAEKFDKMNNSSAPFDIIVCSTIIVSLLIDLSA